MSDQPQADSIYCQECGTQNQRTAKLCTNCGAPLAGPSQPVGGTGAVSPPPATHRQPGLWGQFRRLGCVVQGILWLFFWWILIFVWIWSTPWSQRTKWGVSAAAAAVILLIGTIGNIDDSRQGQPSEAGIAEASPAPVAEAQPTAEPEPTPEPTPQPEPTAEPQTAGPSPEMQAYARDVTEQVRTMSEALLELGTLLQEPRIGNDEWTLQTAAQIVTIRMAHEALEAIDPPPDAAQLHPQILDATGDCNESMGFLETGVDQRDVEALTEASRLMQSCGEKMRQIDIPQY